jgi:hypothetical protein
MDYGLYNLILNLEMTGINYCLNNYLYPFYLALSISGLLCCCYYINYPGFSNLITNHNNPSPDHEIAGLNACLLYSCYLINYPAFLICLTTIILTLTMKLLVQMPACWPIICMA